MDEKGLPVITQRNKFCVGDEIEIMKPDGRNIPVLVQAIYDENGNAMDSAPHPKQELHLVLSKKMEIFDILRKRQE